MQTLLLLGGNLKVCGVLEKSTPAAGIQIREIYTVLFG